MFLDKYLDKFYYNLVINNYDEDYLKSLDEDNFSQVYNLFLDYDFDFVDDIVLNYLQIFTMDVEVVQQKIVFLIAKLGKNFVYIISNNMKYLNRIMD